ncbi:MAG: sugar nucleotide-binding protein [Steroidobacteraceae bacterium]|jgi:dTDP-4-dehydrorhamnose reductase|nr:sugar nucleotide-binding protein [Steroidobacteraceae bacterium]
MTASRGAGLEVWGGVECTINRVGDRYQSQVALSGHDRRIEDLERFAALGLRAIRYPVLWEHVAPAGDPGDADWTWAHRRLGRLRQLGLEPIVGLVHHGSGPRHTHLLDAGFVHGLARYAGEVARRFPWLRRFTPVNEPLTTARFAGAYGLWYPHGRDDASFVCALLTQCQAIVAAMRAIRREIPGAELVQTDDLGRVSSTPRLAYQARFENERRWLGWDLLAGRVDRHHPLWRYLVKHGASPAELQALCDQPCPPDLVGINHYVTSDRWLDDRLERYPDELHGGNGRDRYVDVEAVRVSPEPARGFAGPLREAWERYRLPLAITEVHLGCSREEQLRWFLQAWNAARQARAAGVDVRAVTAWSLLGSFDWNTLLTRFSGHYEPGVFDVRSGEPRPTALARLVGALARDAEPPPSACSGGAGWWQRPIRLLPSARHPAGEVPTLAAAGAPPLLVTGATGTLGRAFGRLCEVRGLGCRLLRRSDMDIGDPQSVAAALDAARPWAVVNAAGYVRVDDAESDGERCERENAAGPRHLALACAARGIPLVTFSSDLVFDGRSTRPYLEHDPVAPLNAYGRSKARAEAAVLASHPGALVVRTSAFFGPWDAYNFLTRAIRTLRDGGELAAADDLVVSPTYVPDLVNACLDLLIDGANGIWHLANPGSVTWYEFARRAARLLEVPTGRLHAVGHRQFGWAAPRPQYVPLGSGRGSLLPPLEQALERYVQAHAAALVAAA